MQHTTIALDAMGGDHGPSVVVPAALAALQKNSHIKLILVGEQDVLQAELRKHNAHTTENLVIRHTSQIVTMDEEPGQALRYKKDSSMRVAINLVKEGIASACVCAGNTGALMATARFVLKTIPGIDRPAISALLPTKIPHKYVRVLDLGANVDSSAEHLFQFAIMGSILASTKGSHDKPSVALLNIGAEDIKGNEQVKQVAKLLLETDFINYVGYVEGDGIFSGNVDVIVCDGFVGNVALKTTEGLAKLIKGYIKDAFQQDFPSKLMGFLAMPVLRRLAKRLDPSHYNGASLVGLQGIVVKSHGGANVAAFTNAINEALLEISKDVPKHISERMQSLLQNRT
ncbi:phosphate acyltransferase PlsX [soil metagenome]